MDSDLRGFILAFSLCVLFTSAKAQHQYVDGYVVTINGDSVFGQIASLPPGRSKQLCRFRTAPESSITKYFPGEIKGYGTRDGINYRSVEFQTLEGPESLFMQTLVDGQVDLFWYRKGAGVMYYLDSDSISAHLKQKFYLKESPKVMLAGVVPAYKQIVWYATEPEGLPQYDLPVAYNRESLTNFLHEHNQAVEPGGSPSFTASKMPLGFSIAPVWILGDPSLFSEAFTLQQNQFRSSDNFSVITGLRIKLSRPYHFSNVFFLAAPLIFHRVSNEEPRFDQNGILSPEEQIISSSETSISLPISIGKEWKMDRWSYFFSVGTTLDLRGNVRTERWTARFDSTAGQFLPDPEVTLNREVSRPLPLNTRTIIGIGAELDLTPRIGIGIQINTDLSIGSLFSERIQRREYEFNAPNVMVYLPINLSPHIR